MSRFRLGLLVPSSNTVMEQEFRAMLPRDISVHVGRIRLRQIVVHELLKMEKQIREEALKLVDADVDAIGFGCTSGSLVRGLGHDKQIVDLIEKSAKRPAVATAGAVVEALRSLRLSRISVATPYVEKINVLEREFLEANGFFVEKMSGLDLKDNLAIGRLKSGTVSNLIRNVNSAMAEGVFLSCTNLPTIGVIARLEKMLGKPLVSSNTATLWAMLKEIRYSLKTARYGRLFLSG